MSKKNEVAIRAWHIGEDGEIFAGRCGPVAMKNWFRKLIGNLKEADESIASCFEEIPAAEMGKKRPWNLDGKNVISSYRKEAEMCVELPMQISTTYN